MGQYFLAVNEDTYEYVSPTRESLKLTCHSCFQLSGLEGNNFLLRVDRLLRPCGQWYKCRLVWAGDSAPIEPGLLRRPNKTGLGQEDVNLHQYVMYSRTGLADGDRMMSCDDPASEQHGRYILNHDKLEFVDITTLPVNKDGVALHPLPILTSTGGGYCNTPDFDKEGSWKGCRISIEEKLPDENTFLELKVAFEDM